MGVFPAQSRQRCDRIREWISLEVDGELSRIERALVDRHLAVCSDCNEFAADVHAFTDSLRAARLEPLARPIVLPRRARVSIRPFQVAAAAAVAVAAVALGTLTNAIREDQLGARVSPASTRVDEGRDQLRMRQLQELTERVSLVDDRPVGTQPV